LSLQGGRAWVNFGASAPAEALFPYFGLTAEAIVPQIKAKLGL